MKYIPSTISSYRSLLHMLTFTTLLTLILLLQFLLHLPFSLLFILLLIFSSSSSSIVSFLKHFSIHYTIDPMIVRPPNNQILYLYFLSIKFIFFFEYFHYKSSLQCSIIYRFKTSPLNILSSQN